MNKKLILFGIVILLLSSFVYAATETLTLSNTGTTSSLTTWLGSTIQVNDSFDVTLTVKLMTQVVLGSSNYATIWDVTSNPFSDVLGTFVETVAFNNTGDGEFNFKSTLQANHFYDVVINGSAGAYTRAYTDFLGKQTNAHLQFFSQVLNDGSTRTYYAQTRGHNFYQFVTTEVIELEEFELTANNSYTDSSISEFNATFSNSTSDNKITTTNGSIFYYKDLIYDIFIEADTYFDRNYTDYDTSASLEAKLFPENVYNNTWNMTSDGGCTSWQSDKSTYCETTDGTPTVTFDTLGNVNCSISTTDYSEYTVSRKCGTTDGTEHICTVVNDDKLVFAEQNLYVQCENEVGDSSLSGSLAINMTAGSGGGLLSCINIVGDGCAAVITDNCAAIISS